MNEKVDADAHVLSSAVDFSANSRTPSFITSSSDSSEGSFTSSAKTEHFDPLLKVEVLECSGGRESIKFLRREKMGPSFGKERPSLLRLQPPPAAPNIKAVGTRKSCGMFMLMA